MVRILSILTRRCRLFAAHNRLMLLILYLTFFTTFNSAQPQPQQPRPSPSTSISNSPLTTQPTKASTPASPPPPPPPTAASHKCNIELSTSWCPPNQTCFITSTTFQCAPTSATTTAGWTITPHLNIIFFHPTNSSSLLLLPSGGECLLLPIPTQNSTHLKILILALKQHDVYYRTSTILISDDPMAIVRGVSSCKNPQERCVEGRCVPVLGYGEVCEGNDECYNPPRAFNSTTYYNPNLQDDEPPQQDTGNGNGGEPLGRVCDYEPGKLDSPPKCIDYIRVHDRPDTDQHIIPPAEQKRKLNWIFAIVVLVVIILFVLLFMCWRKTHGSSRSDGGDDLPQEQEQEQQQMYHQQLQQRYQPYNGDSEDGIKGGGGGSRKYKDTADYLSTNYLKGLSAAGGPGPGQGMGGRRASTGSQTSAHSNVSWGNSRRLSVAENMVMSRRDRDHALDHEFMTRLSQSRPTGSFHRIEQLATSNGHSIGVVVRGGGDGPGVGPMSMEPSSRSMSFDPMQVYPATAPSAVTSGGSGGGGKGGGGGRGRIHELQRQDPSPPPNTPESQPPETMPVV